MKINVDSGVITLASLALMVDILHKSGVRGQLTAAVATALPDQQAGTS